MSEPVRTGRPMGLGSFIGFDATQQKDYQSGRFNEVQALDGWRAYALWSTQTDAVNQNTYSARQLLALPNTIIGWLSLPFNTVVGAVIKYTTLAAITPLGWGLTSILVTSMAGMLVVMVLYGVTDKELRVGTTFRLVLMLLGGVVL